MDCPACSAIPDQVSQSCRASAHRCRSRNNVLVLLQDLEHPGRRRVASLPVEQVEWRCAPVAIHIDPPVRERDHRDHRAALGAVGEPVELAVVSSSEARPRAEQART